MDVNKFEALTYAQAAQGVLFARVSYVDRFQDEPDYLGRDAPAKRKTSGSKEGAGTYFYKVPLGLEIEEKDLAVAQVLSGKFAIVRVEEIFEDPPVDWGYTRNLKWLLSVVDQERSKALTEMDEGSLKSITKASLRNRIQEINAALGFNLKDVVAVPYLGPVTRTSEEDDVIDLGDPTPEGEPK